MSTRNQALIRFTSVIVLAISWLFILAFVPWYLDGSDDNIHSLSQVTLDSIRKIKDTPVIIQAYISEEVPPEFETVKRNVVNLLEAMNQFGRSHTITIDTGEGNSKNVPVISVSAKFIDPYAIEEREDAAKSGIFAQPVQVKEEGKFIRKDVFLGLTIKARGNEEIIPFFGPNVSPEYEVIRALKSALQSVEKDAAENKKKVIGIARTELSVNGGFDMETYSQKQPWFFTEELHKSYEIVDVPMKNGIDKSVDVLIVPMVSDLEQDGMDELMDYLTEGRPALLLDDPFYVHNQREVFAARGARSQGNPFNKQNQQQPKEPKGNGSKFYRDLGLEFSMKGGEWGKRIVWAGFDRYPKIAELQLPLDVSALSRTYGDIKGNHITTKGIFDFLTLQSGEIAVDEDATVTFTPLIQMNEKNSGELSYDNYVAEDNGFMGPRYKQPSFMDYVSTTTGYTIASHITGPLKKAKKDEDSDQKEPKVEKDVNFIFIADVDCISNNMFHINKRDIDDDDKPDFFFDNVSFVLNCIDSLAGDTDLVELRTKGRKHRTLSTIEDMIREENYSIQKEIQKAVKNMEAKKMEKQQEFQGEVDKLKKECDTEGDFWACQQKMNQTRNMLQTELNEELKKVNEELDMVKKRLETKKSMRLNERKESARIAAIFLPPIPILIIGLIIFILIRMRESKDTPTERRKN